MSEPITDLETAVREWGALPMPGGPEPVASQRQPRTMLDHARDALRARMAKDDLRLVLENVVTYAASLEDRIADLLTERHKTNEALDDVVQELRRMRPQTATPGTGCPNNIIDGNVGDHFFKRGAFASEPMRCFYCGTAKPEERIVLAAPAVASLEDPHDSPLHHTYRVGRDLPPLGGAQ